MDVSLQGKKQILQTHARKNLSRGAHKDLWFAVQQGSLADVDSALSFLKKSGSNINSRNIFGLTPLHIATWRNHIPIVRRLLAAGADPDARDGESGWSSLHRAIHFGHLAVASILLQCGASITLEDSKYRTPVDLISGPVLQVLGSGQNSVTTEVFSWGSGANYQLGTGNAHIQKLPCKVDALHDSLIRSVSAAKFHSVAVTARGEVYTWGFGRGGRLGHPDFDIHSGQAAVITPRQVTSGLGSRRVKAVAAAKHHTVIATNGGEVFTWGSNREGQLGYTSVDTQPTPRRVSSLRSKIVAVAAANKHTAVVSDNGEVFTWGCNREGQLGYGTSNSASNYTPRVVEYLKGKVFTGVATAKYHTLVLGVDGEVYTWGHRLVTPKRVVVTRNLKKGGNSTLKFHRKERLHVVSIAAGMVHSMALTDDGALFYWVSSDPDLRCQQLYSLCGRNLVNISAGKYWTASVTATGDVYMWDGKNGKDKPLVATRLHGTKRATSVSVGETHLLIIGSLYHPAYTSNVVKDPQKSVISEELEEIDEDLMFNDIDSENPSPIIQDDDSSKNAVPSLKSICEKVAAEKLVEPRNAIQLLEIADSLMADDLRKYCEDIAIRNFDYIFTVSSQAIAGASPDILGNLEKSLDLKSSEPWSYRRLPTPTATFPAVIYSEEEDSESEVQRTRDSRTKQSTSNIEMHQRPDSFLQPKDDPSRGIGKEVRALRKKLQQIEMLQEKQSNGYLLDDQQIKKLKTRSALENSLADLGVPVETTELKASSSVLPDGKGNKKVELSRKLRRKNKQITTQVARLPASEIEPNPIKGSLNSELCSDNKEEDSTVGEIMTSQTTTESALFFPKEKLDSTNNHMSPTVSKKKSKKGGLSMFLSGALDDSPKYIAPPPTPKSEGPAWGGAKISKGFASLRDIQDEEIKIKVHQSTRNKDPLEDPVIAKGDGKILLSSFLPSKPIPVGSVVSTSASLANEGERYTPPWTASGTPPLARPSLRDIQMQQKGKQQQNLSHSPKTKTAGFSVTNGLGSPLDSSGLNRWFKPEVDAASSIRSIQIEEKAMKDLRRFYNSVKAMARVLLLVLCLCIAAAAATGTAEAAGGGGYLKYKDPKQPLNTRIKDLLGRMTLEEKIGQMTQIERSVASAEVMNKYYIGSVLSGGGSVPSKQASAETWVAMVNDFQKGSLSTRLGIPMIYGIDAVHGHNNVYKATIFPHNVGLGATRDPELVKKIGAATALEVRATGIPYVFAPCIAVCRDPRWGRCYESYSEDHKIVQAMTQIIPGLQGDMPPNSRKGVPFVAPGNKKVAACAKHYVGDGGTTKGINENNTVIDRHGLLSIHMPAYYNSIIEGVATIMVSYSSWNGVKMHANRDMVTGFLKNTLRFRGFVISDWEGIDRITSPPHANYSYSITAGINAGIDMIMVPNNYTEFIDGLTFQVKNKIIPMSRIDDAVRRILRVKFTMGLFENPLADLSLVNQLGSQEHGDLAREAVRRSLVLLKNGESADKPLLPLPKKTSKILVAGSHADNLGYQCGGWTIEWQGMSGNNLTHGTTILTGIKNTVDPETKVVYKENPDAEYVKSNDFSYAIVVVGEPPYAETFGDSLNLSLPDAGLKTITNVCGAVKCVVVVVSGRPVVMQPYVSLLDALVAAWLPGSEGQGVADVLFGDYGFTGKLSRTWFKTVDQLPMNVGDPHYDPLFPFGFGLTTAPTKAN